MPLWAVKMQKKSNFLDLPLSRLAFARRRRFRCHVTRHAVFTWAARRPAQRRVGFLLLLLLLLVVVVVVAVYVDIL